MARILITSGPTRQYLDPVRFLTNASSGRMGQCLAQAALDRGHEAIVVSGPVSLSYPPAASVVPVVTTAEMLEACQAHFPQCDGLIGAAAPCDYRPLVVSDHKIKKTGDGLQLALVETPDIVASLGANKAAGQWTVGFALETEDAHFKAMTKMIRKNCDLVVINEPTAIDAERNEIQVLGQGGKLLGTWRGSKEEIAATILELVEAHLISGPADGSRRAGAQAADDGTVQATDDSR